MTFVSPLCVVLIAKIAITALFWAPLIVIPPSLLRALGVPVPESMIFIRLLGAAYVALLVGYIAGLREALGGGHPAVTIEVGIASNGLAAAILLYYGISGAWKKWGFWAQRAMWASLAATAAITGGLLRYGL